MDSQEHCNPPQSPGGGKSHGAQVCTKCGWNYPNPHPSAKNRRAHKKICGTIKGYELIDSQKAKEILEHCFDDEQKAPSPIVVEKGVERIGDISEEDVFADAVCEFSSGVVSDSFKEKEEIGTNIAAHSTKNPGETQQGNSSSMGCGVKGSEVVQESCEVQPMEVVESYDLTVEPVSSNRHDVKSSNEGHSMASETLTESSQEAKVINGCDTVSDAGLETECEGNLHITNKSNLPDESEMKLALALEKKEDSLDAAWNDEVIYSDLEAPHGFAFEATNMVHPGEADYLVGENSPVDTSPVKANLTQDSSISQSIPDDVSLHGIKGLGGFESNHSVTPKEDECKTDTSTQAENLGIQCDGLSIGAEVSSSDKLPFEEKAEPQQTDLVAVKELPSTDNILITKVVPEDIKMKAEEVESSFADAQETVESETLRVSLPAVDPIVVDSNADVSHGANKTALVDLVGNESELIQENSVAKEGNSPNRKLSSESSCATENYVSPVSVIFEGDDDASDQMKILKEVSEDSAPQIGAEACESNDKEYHISHSGSSGTALDDTAQTANQKLLETGRTEFNRVVGGLGVIQGNEIAGNDKSHSSYAEIPVTIGSYDLRDFGRLQNLSEAQIRSLVSSPLVTRNDTSHTFESNLRSFSGPNASESSSLAVALSKNQEITMEKTTSWSTVKEQHVPLKNLLSEARSPRLQQQVNNHQESNIQRVSSILGDDTSPEEARWPERKEVSEEWNSPAKYPVERKVKGKPFWVPFVCCSSVN